MKKIRKVIAICVSVFLLFSLSVAASPASDEKEAKIVAALQSTEYIKDKIGLEHVDFHDFTIGNPICVYNYIDYNFIKSRDYYPLLINNTLTAFAIEIGTGEELHYQITTDFVSELHSLLPDLKTKFALVFDSSASYVFFNDKLVLLEHFPTDISERTTIQTDTEANNKGLVVQDCSVSTKLDYISAPATARAVTYYQCSINKVSQLPHKNICWAASIACIVNYKKGTNLTAVDVAKAHFGSDFDHQIIVGLQDDILKERYGLNYTYRASTPGEGVILTNIKNNCPILGIFLVKGTQYHDSVIYAIDIIKGNTYVMDPDIGFVTMTYSGTDGYHYISTKYDITLRFREAVCQYW